MVKARSRMLEYLGLKVTSTGFSSIGAQKAAANAGYSIDYEITFGDDKLFNSSIVTFVSFLAMMSWRS